MALALKSGETLLFIGDSITDCGRMGPERPLGNGYVKMFRDLLIAREPAKKITIINKGISGDTVPGLRNRWTDDVLRHKPDWLSIKIGINDLHRALRGTPDAVPPERYAEVYAEIMARTAEVLPKCRILLIDPFYISNDRSPNSWRTQVLAELPKYIATVNKMSRLYRARHVETHAIFQRLLKHYEADTFCGEPVHPNATGHLVIADAVYEELSR